jgi:hypothetical protein
VASPIGIPLESLVKRECIIFKALAFKTDSTLKPVLDKLHCRQAKAWRNIKKA